MKTIPIMLLFSIMSFSGYSQESKNREKEQVKNVINQFFEAIEKKDSILMHSTTMSEAQIWSRLNNEKPVKIDFWFSKDATPKKSWPDMKEIALDFDITVNNNIAVAWVPYEFYIEESFSHCGIDVFTLFKKEDKWKIITLAYTVDKVKCDYVNSKKQN